MGTEDGLVERVEPADALAGSDGEIGENHAEALGTFMERLQAEILMRNSAHSDDVCPVVQSFRAGGVCDLLPSEQHVGGSKTVPHPREPGN